MVQKEHQYNNINIRTTSGCSGQASTLAADPSVRQLKKGEINGLY